MWTSLGLNQGPPDYENDKMIFSDSLLLYTLLIINYLQVQPFPMTLTKYPKLKPFVYALFTQN